MGHGLSRPFRAWVYMGDNSQAVGAGLELKRAFGAGKPGAAVRPMKHPGSLKIVNYDFRYEGLHALRDELEMLRMRLIIILRLLAGKHGV